MAIITDDNESVVARYEYDAFGAVRHQWGNSDNTRKFTGKEYDADVKLYYYAARYYDPYIESSVAQHRRSRMRFFGIVGILCLLVFAGCGEHEGECPLNDEGYFEMQSLDIDFGSSDFHSTYPILEATLTEMPHTGNSGYFILRDEEDNDYRFEPTCCMDWEGQLDVLQVGKTYRFVFIVWMRRTILGMKVSDGELLLYMAASYVRTADYFDGAYGYISEGFETYQFRDPDSYCVPVNFKYGDREVKLYQSQETVFATPRGEYVTHLLHSSISPTIQKWELFNPHYSFYIKRLKG